VRALCRTPDPAREEILASTATAQAVPPSPGSADASVGTHDESSRTVQSWSGANIARLIKSRELAQALERWRYMVASRLPRLNEFVGYDPNQALLNAMLLVPTGNDLLFVHHGAGVAKIIGTNFTGKLHSELVTPTSIAINAVYLKSVATGQAFYLRFVSSFSQQHFCIEQIILPLAADDRRQVGLVLIYSAPMDYQLEVLKGIFERSPIGKIAAVADYDESGKLQDGRVLLINARARAILKIPENERRIVTVSDLGPWFHSGALWTKVKVISNGGQTHILYRDQFSGDNYRLSIDPFDHFVLFSISEVPKMVE
jgi:PAS domain-containing protein